MNHSHNRYQNLDFLRGVAAVLVVMFHFSTRLNILGLFDHGYLAVDFFFTLSGFVIEHAYGEQIRSQTLGFKSFFFLRIVRLLPLVVCGTLLAAIIDLFRRGEFSIGEHVADIVVAGVMSCLCLPTFWATTLEQTTFPLNGPVWSLSFELLANLCCVPILRSKRSKTLFATLALLSIAILTWALIVASANHYDLNFGTHADNFLLGFPRVAWTFSLGILLTRFENYAPPINKWICATVLTLVLICPELHGQINTVFYIIVTSFVFPLIILGSTQYESTQDQFTSKWSGDMSYPLYAIHYPLVRAVSTIIRQVNLPPLINFLVATAATCFFVFLAILVFKTFDVPIRRRLSRWIVPHRVRIAPNP